MRAVRKTRGTAIPSTPMFQDRPSCGINGTRLTNWNPPADASYRASNNRLVAHGTMGPASEASRMASFARCGSTRSTMAARNGDRMVRDSRFVIAASPSQRQPDEHDQPGGRGVQRVRDAPAVERGQAARAEPRPPRDGVDESVHDESIEPADRVRQREVAV